MEVVKAAPAIGFNRFELRITVESEEEARALYAIFNHTNNVELLPEGSAERIRRAIGKDYYSIGLIANGITHEQFYGD